MPPRRTTRSARASAEPPPVEKSNPAKRKRGLTVEDVTEEEVEEAVEAPDPPVLNARKTNSNRSVATSKAKGRTLSRTIKKEIEESGAGELLRDSPPPVKKSRKSLETEDGDETNTDNVVKPAKKDRRAPAPRATTSTGSRKGRTASATVAEEIPETDDEGEEQERDDSFEEPKTTSRSRGSTTKRSGAAKAGKNASRQPTGRAAQAMKDAREKTESVDISDMDSDLGGDSVPTRRKAGASPRKTRIRLSSDSSADSAPKDTDTALPRPQVLASRAGESEDEEVAAELATVDEPQPDGDLEDEPETSLLDPSPSLASAKVVPPALEEQIGPKSRLVIHKMALVNFKSYAGRQEIGPFHKSFSAIVGPNGSGKSNTIDALLFVFGYRASKMRQAKLSELIHNSARYPDLDDCSVEVHFREIVDLPGPDAFTVVPNSQLVVARTAYKNNSSKYTINGRMSNFTEVQTLLKGRGIDLDHKRFLILQGEVESIAQMKPKAPSEHEDGLLEYLEDIIGTSKYKQPIDEALVEVEKYAEERAEKLNRLRIVEREKDALEEKKKEAEDYLRLQNEHVRALSRLWQFYLWKCLLNEEKFEVQITELEQKLVTETEKNKDDIAHCEALAEHYKEREAAYEEVKTAATEALKDLATHEKQEVGLDERRKHANGKAKKLKKTLQEDERAKAEALRAIETNEEKMEREKGKVDEHEASLEQEEKVLEGIRDSLKDKTQVFHDQIEVKQKELAPWTAKINATQAEIDVASSERDMLAKKVEGIKTAGKDAQEALEKLQADQDAKAAEQDTLKADRSTLLKEVKAAQKKLQDTQGHVQDLRNKASSSRQKADEARASQTANTSQNKVLDSLNRLKATGRIDGFHGRLGSLGTIPDKYDVAVSTACGALNNLIVDTVEQGQACIEYLRQQSVGRASFIVLEKLSQTNGLEKIATPENVPRLFDLIKPKEARFAPAFFKGVGNTLVADDLDQANRIAFGGQRRWRVVTLAGQLIDSSGTMSGGGNHVAKGGMSSKLAADTVQPEVLKRYEKESEQASLLLEETIQELHQCEADLDTLSKRGPQLDIALQKLDLDIQTGKKRIVEAEKRVRDLKSQSKPDAGDLARISTLEKEIAASTQELNRLQEKSGAIESLIRDLEKKILDIGGAKLLSQKSKVDGIRLHINLANDEITKAEVTIAKAQKDVAKLELAIVNNSSTLEEVEHELEELNDQLAECAQYVANIRDQVNAAQIAAENSKDDLDNLKAELDSKMEGIQAFRQKEMELEQSLNDVRKEAAENDRALDHWRTEHDKLQLEELDDDDDNEEDDKENDEKNPEENANDADAEVKRETANEPNPKKKVASFELHIYSVEELSAFKKREMVADAELLDEKLKTAKPNMSALKEYRKREQQFLQRAKELEQITKLRDEHKQLYDGLRKQRLDEFMTGFSLISSKLKEMYQMITLGGNAELELVDSMDPFSEGIIFSVMPPKKSWKNISNLSGGEKTLSSLALVFALHVFKPTPLYFMDEIDAALDFRNVSIVANYIKDRTKNAQFIIISLRNDMFELSHRLIGIYKTANATRSISIDNHALSAVPGMA